jgi:flagellar motility protein MotE (MotC chaperone)
MFFLLLPIHCSLPASNAFAQDDTAGIAENKQKEIKGKEEALKKEEERLNILKKDVEDKIEKYTKLLTQLENTLKKTEQVKDERMGHIVKAYDAMSPEEAAARLNALDEGMAVKIMRMMKSKKAGAIMAIMEPKKAALLTKQMAEVKLDN